MASTRIDRQLFLANLRRSNLLSPEQFEAAVRQLPDTNRAWVVARVLVERGVLTKFQAEMLLGGRTSGFTLGQYRILDQLGRGGMGRVFKAVHQTMNRVAALKVISSSLLKTPRAQQMFLREVHAAARLMHPNIVTAYDANQSGDRHYMVMEFVNGPTLEHLVRDKGPLPVGLACEFARQAADGLQYAFEMGMLHRDLKPDNLLVQGADGDPRAAQCVVKILDFGLARLHEPRPKSEDPESSDGSIETEENTVMGTPDYISPEQAKDLHRTDIRSDIYSLGCTFYFLLTGQVPYPGGTTLEKLVRHGTEEADSVEQLRPEIPAAVGAIVRRAMAKDHIKRFQTPAELAEALAPFAVNGPPTWKTTEPELPEEENLEKHPPTVPQELDEGNALAGTIPGNQSPTPSSGVETAAPIVTEPSPGLSLFGLLLSFLIAVSILLVLVALFWR